MADAACLKAIVTAYTYVSQKTATWSTEHCRARIQDPTCRALAHAIDAAALRGDLRATQQACRAWWQALLGGRR